CSSDLGWAWLIPVKTELIGTASQIALLQAYFDFQVVAGVGIAEGFILTDFALVVEVHDGLIEGFHALLFTLLHDVANTADFAFVDQILDIGTGEHDFYRSAALAVFAFE